MKNVIPPKLQRYGQLMFLTYQCLLIQVLNALLHVVAHFVKPLRGLRDLVFSALAYPIGSLVVYTFWAVWFLVGRDKIFPKALDSFYPLWLNHTTHTIIVPINLLLAFAISHKYVRNGFLLTLAHSFGYTIFLHVVKAQSGMFVYGYLDELGDIERLIYFAITGLFTYAMYKSGQLATHVMHGSGKQAQSPSKKQKQK